MKKRSCRRTGFEQEQHDRAIRVRKMTDAQLCEYLDGLRVSDATVRKLKAMARRDGFLPPLPEIDDDML